MTDQYSTTEGNPRLRAAVASRLTDRGLPTGPDELLVCSGSQQALTLTATALLEPGEVVLFSLTRQPAPEIAQGLSRPRSAWER